MAIIFDENGKYVDEKGFVKLDPTKFADWQIAEEAEKTLPPVDFFREKLGLLPEEIIPYGKTPKIDFIKVMNRLKDKPDGKFIEVTAVTPHSLRRRQVHCFSGSDRRPGLHWQERRWRSASALRWPHHER